MKYLYSALTFALLVASAFSAAANPRPLPFTYNVSTNPKGVAEVEQIADLVPIVVADGDGKRVRTLATQFQTEIEYGITDRLELGLYFVLSPQANIETTEATGLKQRLRWRLADEGAWPIDVALYGEVVENTREIEIEAKLILQRRFGNFLVATNLGADEEFYFGFKRELVLHPTLGVSYQVTPSFHAGLEYWMRAEFSNEPGPRDFNAGPHHYIGPTMLFSWGKLWWSMGLYARANDFGRRMEIGDSLGNTWLRTMVGIQL